MKEVLFTLILMLTFNGNVTEDQQFEVTVDETRLLLNVKTGMKSETQEIVISNKHFFGAAACKSFGRKTAEAIRTSEDINYAAIFSGYGFMPNLIPAFTVTYKCVPQEESESR